MHKNYKVDWQVMTNILYRHIKPTEPQKQTKLIIYYTKFKTSKLIIKNNTTPTQANIVYRFTCQFRECFPENNT